MFVSAFVLFICFACRDGKGVEGGLLDKENAIFEKSGSEIQQKQKQFKEAERNNQLQRQLDLKRELNALINKTNDNLREYAERQDSLITVPFIQSSEASPFKIKGVKIAGCRVNEELMDLQIQLSAEARVMVGKSHFIPAELCDSSGGRITETTFNLTGEYPENGKIIRLTAHVEGSSVLKAFSSLRFK